MSESATPPLPPTHAFGANHLRPPAGDAPRTGPVGLAMALAACGPFAIGGLLAARTGTYAPMVAVPAVVFGVLAATSPALYIASAATGTAPPLAGVLRAFAHALGAFGIVLAGLLLPATFLSLSSLAPFTTFAVTSATIGGAALLALHRLATELRTEQVRPSLSATAVFTVWWVATFGIAGRLWWDLAGEVLS